MGVVPQTLIGKIQFYEAHLPVWAKDPTAIGLTAIQLAQLANDTAQARADYDAALAVRNTAKALTQAQKDSASVMATFGEDLIKTIKAFAETTNDSSDYVIEILLPPASRAAPYPLSSAHLTTPE